MRSLREELLSLLTEDDYDLPELAVQASVARSDLSEAVSALLDEGLAKWVVRVGESEEVISLSGAGTGPPDPSVDSLWELQSERPSRYLLRVTKAGWVAYFGRPPEPGDLRW